jgi:hypothetical protein
MSIILIAGDGSSLEVGELATLQYVVSGTDIC